MQNGFGAIPSPFDIRDYTVAKAVDMSEIPQIFDLGVLKIKNQGTKPTCVAHALSEIIEYHNMKAAKQFSTFSTDFIYGCRVEAEYIGDGMYLRDGLKIAQKYGDVLKDVLPGNNNYETAMKIVQANFSFYKNIAYPNRISTYYKIQSVDELKYAIYNHGPVLVGMRWYDGCSLSHESIYRYDKNRNFSGHAVIITGWTKKYLIVQNSWGYTWGKGGRFYIPIDKAFSDIIFEAYGITDDINFVNTKQKTKFFAPHIVNAIVNTVRKIKHKK